MTKIITVITIATILLLGSISFAIPPVDAVQIWTASGTGTVTVTDPDIDDDGEAQYTYFNRGFSGSSTFQTIATTTGTETIDWNLRFFHAFFNVRLNFNGFDPTGVIPIINAGPQNCCTFPSGGGVVAGQITFNTVAGQPYGFTITGSNFDRDNRVLGTLTINKIVVPVDIDIKPGSDPSSVNCKNLKGNVPVAVFGSADFDATTIDPNSLELNGVAVTEVHKTIQIEDVNNDGTPDAVLHLDKAGVCEATADEEAYPLKDSADAILTGSNADDDFEGIGDIRIVKR